MGNFHLIVRKLTVEQYFTKFDRTLIFLPTAYEKISNKRDLTKYYILNSSYLLPVLEIIVLITSWWNWKITSTCKQLWQAVYEGYNHMVWEKSEWGVPKTFLFSAAICYFFSINKKQICLLRPFRNHRSSHSQMFFKIGVLNTRKHLLWSLFLIKLQSWSSLLSLIFET